MSYMCNSTQTHTNLKTFLQEWASYSEGGLTCFRLPCVTLNILPSFIFPHRSFPREDAALKETSFAGVVTVRTLSAHIAYFANKSHTFNTKAPHNTRAEATEYYSRITRVNWNLPAKYCRTIAPSGAVTAELHFHLVRELAWFQASWVRISLKL